ncbi:glycoside hydrolase family 6 protein [Pantoea sp. BAV 3049]|uniref:glycoside hydrolase family 6 protein n=1 Tax=Pantoea sp. BAV 3049 TaxID=2654188 RepID=UPI00131D1F32|nr:glycoside hydrolase family 6 protein [Pantoea sp. BAV 3049]
MKKLLCCAGVIFTLFTAQASAAEGYYVNPKSNAAVWVKNNPSDSRAATIKAKIADVPTAHWFSGTSQADNALKTTVSAYVTAASNAGKIPLLVAYNIPHRDCTGGASAGGASDAAAYQQWIDNFVSGLSTHQAVVVLEPDALADISCLTANQQTERLSLLSYAVSRIQSKATATEVYLDAGHANWIAAATMAKSLNDANVKNARGFALNVSNYYTTQQSIDYGNSVIAALSSNYGYSKSIIIDTSRNGNGANAGDWCNPPGRKIGAATGVLFGYALAAWIKTPGNSDGGSSPTADCHGGPAAGIFSPDLAMKLINGE